MITDSGIVGVAAAVCTLISTVVLAWMQKTTKIAVDQSAVKLDDAVIKRGQIHDLVNSNYSVLANDVKSANDRLEIMQGILDKLIGEVKLRNGDHPRTQEVKIVNPKNEPVPVDPQKTK